MADKHSYDVTINGETYTVDSDTPLSESQAYEYAKTQVPFDVKKQNAIMQANMAKQAGVGAPDTLADFATSGPMGNFNDAMAAAGRGEGAKAAHSAVIGTGKVLAPTLIPFVAAAPAAAALSFGGGIAGDVLARKAASLVTDNPDYQDVAGDIGGIIGGSAGAKTGTKFAEPVMRFAGDTLRNPKPLRVQAGEALLKFANRDNAAVGAKQAALAEGEQIVADTKAAQLDDAIKTNRHITRDRKLAADALAKKDPRAMTGAEVARTMQARLGLDPTVANGDNALDNAVSASHSIPAPSRGTRGPAPQGTGQTRTVDLPLHEQQTAMETGEILTGRSAAEPPPSSRAVTPRHPQQGAGGRGQEMTSPQDVANSYASANGFPEPAPHKPVTVDPEFGKRVADAYSAMTHDPNDPETSKAYAALAKEVEAQFEHITSQGGLKVEPWTKEGQPYASSKEMVADVKQNGHMFYFPTESGFGTGASAENPLLAKGKNGMPFNDMLRVVHDYFAHAVEGHQFGPNGEENAFLAHLKMLSPDAGRALATETRGQNSFVNFGPHMRSAAGELLKPGDKGFVRGPDRPFAEQKTGLLPDELLPASLRRGVGSAVGDDEMLTLEHRSGQEGLTSLNPTKQGSGQAGAEKQRQSAFPDVYLPRSYSTLAGGKVEPRFAGSKVYTTQVPKASVYDFREDPLHLLADAKAQTGPGEGAKTVSLAEKLAHDKGFTTVTFDGNTYQHTAPLKLTAVGATPAKGLEASMSADERALIGNRKKGALTLAQRKALLDAIRKRSGQ